MSPTISLIGILIGIVLLIWISFRGVPVMFVAPVCAMIVFALSGVDIMEGMSTVYMTGFANFFKSYYLIFFFGAVFGRIMGDSGAAKSIAFAITRFCQKLPGDTAFWSIAGLVIISSILTYGGISVFVIMFVMVAIGRELFQQQNIPWKMYGCVCLGSGAYTLTCVPGTPSVNNTIPIEYFGTNTMAAPVLSIIGTITMLVLGLAYIAWEVKRLRRKGEGFLPTGEGILKESLSKGDENFKEVPLLVALIPSICLLIALNIFHLKTWSAIMVAVIVALLLFHKRLDNPIKSMEEGGVNSLKSTGVAAFVIAFGSAVGAVSGFELVVQSLDKIPGPPIVQVMVAVNVCAGITGSSSGGLTIALNNLSERFLSTGIDPQVLHRITAVCSGGLDSLPHCGTVVNSMMVYRINHKMSYKYYFMLNTVVPIVASIVMAACYTLFGWV